MGISTFFEFSMNVLIVDDNHTNCQLLRAVLEGEGHAVIVAENDHEALVLLERRPVDAIISDLLMPNFDGHRLGKEIRRDKRWRDIPLICYTEVNLKTRMEGPKIASFCSRVSICGSMGSHPEGPSRSDGISLMLSRLRRFDSRHSRF